MNSSVVWPSFGKRPDDHLLDAGLLQPAQALDDLLRSADQRQAVDDAARDQAAQLGHDLRRPFCGASWMNLRNSGDMSGASASAISLKTLRLLQNAKLTPRLMPSGTGSSSRSSTET